MYSFLINTLFSNEMTGSDLLFGNFAKNINDTGIPDCPHFCFPILRLLLKVFLHSDLSLQRKLFTVSSTVCFH